MTTTLWRLRSMVVAAPLLLLLLLPSCSDTVEPGDLLGAYQAVELSGEDEGVPFDFLDEGGSLSITLAANGTTTGTLFLPGAGEAGEDINASMAGTWAYDDGTNTLTFDQAADTYVRDATWTVDGDRIEGSFASDDQNFVTTVLEK